MTIQEQASEVLQTLKACDGSDALAAEHAVDAYEALLARIHAEHESLGKLSGKERYALFGALTTAGMEAVTAIGKEVKKPLPDDLKEQLRRLQLRLQAATNAFIMLATVRPSALEVRS